MKQKSASVVTPSLNKSFKFQSDWPYNNSQVYLLNSIIDDLKTDEDKEFKTKDDGYLFKSKVNYPNNKSLVGQNVYVTKKGKIKKVEVVDKEGNAQIIMDFKKEEYNKKFDKNYFELSSLLEINQNKEKKAETKKENTNEEENREGSEVNNKNNTPSSPDQNATITPETNKNENQNTNTNQSEKIEEKKEETSTKTTTSINDIVYPMYLPNNTYLTNQEKVNTQNGERLILTFGGDSAFILVEETSKIESKNLVIPVSGDFDFLTDVIGIIGKHSLSWNSNGIDYYIASDVIETAELIDIARSISVLPVSK